MKRVVIVDYGMGNLLSVKRAFEYCGVENVSLASSPEELRNASHIVLPGVGAFREGIKEIKKRSLDKAIHELIVKDIPLLGICLGMQMLLDESEENGTWKGLGLIPGKVVKIPKSKNKELIHKIPSVGWYGLKLSDDSCQNYARKIFGGNQKKEPFYFVHSFMAVPNKSSYLFATYDLNDISVPAIIAKDNIIACQFHPEKSGEQGLQIIQNFIAI